MWNSLRIRLTVIFIGLAIGPLVLVGVILAQSSFATEQAQALDLQRQVAQRVSAEIDTFLGEVENHLNLLGGEIRSLENPDRAQQLSLLLSALSSGPYRNVYESLALLDPEGQEQLRVSRDEIVSADNLADRSNTEEFLQPRTSGETYFGPVEFDESAGAAFMTIAVPLFELRSVKLSGVLVADVRFKAVSDLIAGLRISEGQTVYVVADRGNVVAHQDPSMLNRSIEPPEQAAVQTGLNGNNAVLAVDPIHGVEQTLLVTAERPAAEALRAAINTVYTITLTLVGALIIAGGLGFLVVRQIVRPVENLADTAQAVSEGDLSRQVEVSSRDEIGTLAGAFNSMTAQLRRLIDTLEQRVVERTQRLEVVAVLGERLNAILDFDQLLAELVEQVKESFGYYHAHVYIIDEERQSLVMTAGAGEAGAAMKARGHSIPLAAPTSLVARAARTGEIVRVDNVREAKDWLPNPLLPDTYSEMAVPIIVEGQVVGVLDVQEDEIADLDEGDANLLRSLANQVAVAIRNARLFEEVESALAEARALQQQYVEQAWDSSKVAQRSVGRVQFSLGESTALDETTIARARQEAMLLQKSRVVAINGQESTDDQELTKQQDDQGDASHYAFVAPLTLHNVPIGDLQLHEVDPDKKWTEGELALINAVIDQVAQAAENLRLINETQEKASRERLIGQISDKLRKAPDLENLMKIGVEELSRVLRPARTFVQFGPQDELGIAPAEKSKNQAAAQPQTHPTTSEDGLEQNGQGDK